jgi:magnesium-transporting ATPase (P-type)
MCGLDTFVREFKTNLETGLTREEVDSGFAVRRRQYGVNILPPPPTKTFSRMFWAAFKNLTLHIVCITAVISLILSATFPPDHCDGDYPFLDFVDPIAVVLCVILIAATQAKVHYTQQQSFVVENDYCRSCRLQPVAVRLLDWDGFHSMES